MINGWKVAFVKYLKDEKLTKDEMGKVFWIITTLWAIFCFFLFTQFYSFIYKGGIESGSIPSVAFNTASLIGAVIALVIFLFVEKYAIKEFLWEH